MINPTPVQQPLLQPMAPETIEATPLLGAELLPQKKPLITEQPPPPPPAVAPPTELPSPPLPPPQPPTIASPEEQRLEQLKEELASALGVSPEYLTGALSLALPGPASGEGTFQISRGEVGAVSGRTETALAAALRGFESASAPLPGGLTPLQIAKEQLDICFQICVCGSVNPLKLV